MLRAEEIYYRMVVSDGRYKNHGNNECGFVHLHMPPLNNRDDSDT